MTDVNLLTQGGLRFRHGLEIDSVVIESFTVAVDNAELGDKFESYIGFFNDLVNTNNHLFNYVSDLMELQVDNIQLSDEGWLTLRKFFQYAHLCHYPTTNPVMKDTLRRSILVQEHTSPTTSDDTPHTLDNRRRDLDELYEECSMTDSPVDMDLFFHTALFNDPALLRLFVYKFYLGR